MQFVTTTPLALFFMAYIYFQGPVKGLWCLFFAFPIGAAAALNVSGLGSIYLTDFVIIIMWSSLIFAKVGMSHLFATIQPFRPGFTLLILLFWSTLSALFMPRFFSGQTEVMMLVNVPDIGPAFRVRPLEPTTQNISQSVRLAIAASAFVLMATLFRMFGTAAQIHRGVILATALNVIVTVLDIGSYAVGMPDLLDVIRTSNLAMLDNQYMLGVKRVAGGFSEASSYGWFTMGLFAYWLCYWFSGHSSWKSGLTALLMFVLIVRSTSSSTYVALGAFVFIYFVWHFRTLFQSRRALVIYLSLMSLVPLVLTVVAMIFTLNPILGAFADEILLDKMSSDSGVERMSWNQQSLTAMLDTWGLGAGIGSVRASSFLFACLGNIGIIGTVLYLTFIAQVLLKRVPKADRKGQPAAVVGALQASMVGFLIQAQLSFPYPNLEVVFFAHAGLAYGVAHKLEIRRRRTVARAIAEGRAIQRGPRRPWLQPA